MNLGLQHAKFCGKLKNSSLNLVQVLNVKWKHRPEWKMKNDRLALCTEIVVLTCKMSLTPTFIIQKSNCRFRQSTDRNLLFSLRYFISNPKFLPCITVPVTNDLTDLREY